MSTDETRPTTPGDDDATRPLPPHDDDTQTLPSHDDDTQTLPPHVDDTQTLPTHVDDTQTLPTADDTQVLPSPEDATRTLPRSDAGTSAWTAATPTAAPTATAETPTATATVVEDEPAVKEAATRPRLRVGTVVWGLVLAAIGVGLLAWAAGLSIDVQLAIIVLLAVAGAALLVGSIVSATRASRR